MPSTLTRLYLAAIGAAVVIAAYLAGDTETARSDAPIYHEED